MDIEQLKFDEKGLIPVVVQDAETNVVVMVAYMNEEALEETLKTGYMHYFSRSRPEAVEEGRKLRTCPAAGRNVV